MAQARQARTEIDVTTSAFSGSAPQRRVTSLSPLTELGVSTRADKNQSEKQQTRAVRNSASLECEKDAVGNVGEAALSVQPTNPSADYWLESAEATCTSSCEMSWAFRPDPGNTTPCYAMMR